MKSKLKIVYPFIILGLLLTIMSCKPLSKLRIEGYPIEKISKDNYTELNGIYSNQFDTIIGKLEHSPGHGTFDILNEQTIMSQLFWPTPEQALKDDFGKRIEPEYISVKIEFESSKKAIVSMYQNDQLLFSKSIRGKFKNGYFYLRPKFFIIPLFPLIYGHHFERTRIGKTGNNLTIDYNINTFFIMVMGGGFDKGYASSIYRHKLTTYPLK